ncbi:hypothetical protein I553_3848 [Mycobacterium xenopi 4042]|uniref:Uncharacterized protein n=1 Tax=Mycobacterium xenopi 4042 TaxID=1299334 RepID=X8AMD6_MYCXE|nr:hypothetical protein I553_3848 [Mycobacterium xenopi 4042]
MPRYRYRLVRVWDSPSPGWLGDAQQLRCQRAPRRPHRAANHRFRPRWGYGGIDIANLYGFVSKLLPHCMIRTTRSG